MTLHRISFTSRRVGRSGLALGPEAVQQRCHLLRVFFLRQVTQAGQVRAPDPEVRTQQPAAGLSGVQGRAGAMPQQVRPFALAAQPLAQAGRGHTQRS